jgi:hypothetical protein
VLQNFSSMGLRTNLMDMLVEPSTEALLRIVDGINRVRMRQPGQTFRRLGDLLSVPELSVAFRPANGNSPFLNFADPFDQRYGMNDQAVERIPQQILSLLKLGDARYVIYGFGQSLKPADQSIVTSGPFMGMCTNYQVTGEFVSRAVLRVDGTAGNPRPILEKFNVLPLE